MSDLPPFEPPYQSVAPDLGRAIAEFESSPGGISGLRAAPPAAGGKSASPASPKGDVLYLVVPFAEKDEAKRLGARWDAAAKKWYVPAGKDAAAFKPWLVKS